jgi:alpha-glucosidase
MRILKTTPAHQLALSLIYYSPLQFLYWYDKPSDSQDEPELKFFDDLYTTWDDTKVLEGAPGQYIRMARRHGRNGSSGPLPIMIVVRLPSVLISWMAICHI